jgi:hypothetical protein
MNRLEISPFKYADTPTDRHLPLMAALCYFSANITAEKF